MQSYRTDESNTVLERIFNPARALDFQNEYLRYSSTLTYSYLAVLPLLLLYEIGIALVNSGPGGIRISSDILIKQMLSAVGMGSTIGFAVLIVVIGAGAAWYERRHGLKIKGTYVGLMFLEGAVLALILGSIVGVGVGSMFGVALPSLQAPGSPEGSLALNFFLSLGAGIYEEFVFRFLLVTLLYVLLYGLVRLLTIDIRSVWRYAIAAVIGALIFSAVHYTGSLGDDFSLASFTFRFAMGLALNGLMLVRGFGVTAIAHALYDVYVTVVI